LRLRYGGKIHRLRGYDPTMDFRMLRAKHLLEMSSGVAVAGSVSQQDDATCRRQRRGNLRIVARLLRFALPAQLAVLPVTQVMKKMVRIVRAECSSGFRRAPDGKETCLMVVYSHYHVGCWRFRYTLILGHLHRCGRCARTFQKPAKLRHFLCRQFFGMRRVKYVSVLTDREQQPAVRFPVHRTEPFDEMQSVRPGGIARKRVAENRLKCAPIPIENPVRCCQLISPRVRLAAAAPSRLRVIHTTIKRESVAQARQD